MKLWNTIMLRQHQVYICQQQQLTQMIKRNIHQWQQQIPQSLAPKDLYACHCCCGFSLLHYGNQHLGTSTNLTSSWAGPRNLGHTAGDAILWLTVLACGICYVCLAAPGADTYFVSVHSIALLNADPIKTGFGRNRTRLWTLWGRLCVILDPLLDRSVLCFHHKMYEFLQYETISCVGSNSVKEQLFAVMSSGDIVHYIIVFSLSHHCFVFLHMILKMKLLIVCGKEEVRPLFHTIAAKVDHDVSLSVHDPGKSKRSYVTPYFEGAEKGIVDCLFIQIRRVPENSVRKKKKQMAVKTWVCTN